MSARTRPRLDARCTDHLCSGPNCLVGSRLNRPRQQVHPQGEATMSAKARPRLDADIVIIDMSTPNTPPATKAEPGRHRTSEPRLLRSADQGMRSLMGMYVLDVHRHLRWPCRHHHRHRRPRRSCCLTSSARDRLAVQLRPASGGEATKPTRASVWKRQQNPPRDGDRQPPCTFDLMGGNHFPCHVRARIGRRDRSRISSLRSEAALPSVIARRCSTYRHARVLHTRPGPSPDDLASTSCARPLAREPQQRRDLGARQCRWNS